MRSNLTFRVVGVGLDGRRFLLGERFLQSQAETVGRRLLGAGKFREILVEPDSFGETQEVVRGRRRLPITVRVSPSCSRSSLPVASCRERR